MTDQMLPVTSASLTHCCISLPGTGASFQEAPFPEHLLHARRDSDVPPCRLERGLWVPPVWVMPAMRPRWSVVPTSAVTAHLELEGLMGHVNHLRSGMEVAVAGEAGTPSHRGQPPLLHLVTPSVPNLSSLMCSDRTLLPFILLSTQTWAWMFCWI